MDIKTLFDKAAYQMVTENLSDKYTKEDINDLHKCLKDFDKTFRKASDNVRGDSNNVGS